MKNTFKPAALRIAALLFLVGGPVAFHANHQSTAHAQQRLLKDEDEALAHFKTLFARTRSGIATPEEYKEMAEAYIDAAYHPTVVTQIVRAGVVDIPERSPEKLMLLQIGQNQRLIEQNDKIIALLRLQAKQQ